MILTELPASIQKIIGKLNFEWFKSKKLEFETNKFILKVKNPSEPLLVDNLIEYCWGRYYSELSESSQTDWIMYEIDAVVISKEVLNHVKLITNKYSNINAINTIIHSTIEAVSVSVLDLKNTNSNQEYHLVLENFHQNTIEIVNKEFKHIDEQFQITDNINTVDRKLTIEICSKIANFKLNNKKLITGVKPDKKEGEILFYLLKSEEKVIPDAYLSIEDWANQDFYYLLQILISSFSDKIILEDIERKNVLHLKHSLPFKANKLSKFRTEKLEFYKETNKNKYQIESQFTSLFTGKNSSIFTSS